MNSPTNKTQSTKKVAIIGARGYSGVELARVLLQHPGATLHTCFAGEQAFSLSDYLSEESALSVPVRPMSELPALLPELDAIFLATPAEASLEFASKILESANAPDVIDLSGAFRLQSGGNSALQKAQYKKWYSIDHPRGDLLDAADYGLSPFIAPKASEKARLVANPGCYATSILMAIVPLLREKVILPESLVIDAKSGASGAGRKAAEHLLLTELEGECLPYRIGRHQHTPEIVEWTKALTGIDIDPIFSTSLLPVRRGIISGIYAKLAPGKKEADITNAFANAYRGYSLIRFGNTGFEKHSIPAAASLSLRRVVGSARTHLHYQVAGEKLYLYSLIDNLLKGAASQAVENFNQLYNFPTGLGLEHLEGIL